MLTGAVNTEKQKKPSVAKWMHIRKGTTSQSVGTRMAIPKNKKNKQKGQQQVLTSMWKKWNIRMLLVGI